MVLYICNICNYTTDDKSRYHRHQKRKNPCKPPLLEMVTKSELAPYGSFSGSFCSEIAPFSEKSFDCMYCGKVFSKKSNLKRHMVSNCKIMKSQMSELESINNELVFKFSLSKTLSFLKFL